MKQPSKPVGGNLRQSIAKDAKLKRAFTSGLDTDMKPTKIKSPPKKGK